MVPNELVSYIEALIPDWSVLYKLSSLLFPRKGEQKTEEENEKKIQKLNFRQSKSQSHLGAKV